MVSVKQIVNVLFLLLYVRCILPGIAAPQGQYTHPLPARFALAYAPLHDNAPERVLRSVQQWP